MSELPPAFLAWAASNPRTSTVDAIALSCLESVDFRREFPMYEHSGRVPLDRLDAIDVVPPAAGPLLDAWNNEKARIISAAGRLATPDVPRIHVQIANDSALSLALTARYVGADLAAARELGLAKVAVELHHPKFVLRSWLVANEIRRNYYRWWERAANL